MRISTASTILTMAVGIIAGVAFLASRTRDHARPETEIEAAPAANHRPRDESSLEKSVAPLPVDPVIDEPRAAVENPAASAIAPAIEAPVEPAAQDTVGDRSTWPAEYANKSLEVLVADEKRLRAENQADLDAEIEKRFADGRVVTYRQGEQPKGGVTFGILRSRGDEHHIRYVEIDPRYEPQWWRKESKANWLVEEIRRRR